ncbi:homeobox-domain-containing protein [Punctularia strigosozonata HHB-11173 SS5]|uniref:homeobox-domain-containing protein n=1 Tax=Punctularia strigosozonata (strain HHB-11173) TaxID=741275 RepID=UPI000441855D|nr:homeobox-domain-containing protein [Punctularia strigosozonata HHB-11173 SS5]EIN06522.1 homeobox-domain-containing protein [Punctularia strigosozonata HHB-11173 SS5]
MRMRSPSSSSSRDDLADTEEPAVVQRFEQPVMGEPPAKKKRTRMLLTPYQSSVLNALFSQSRFPTTAMREEVGRSIGLSARKVQIWFQNQRQKAKRPRSQGTASSNQPPQYGPFTNAPPMDPEAAGADPELGLRERRFGYPGPPPSAEGALPSGLPTVIMLPEPGGLTAPGMPLSGPGVPGSTGGRSALPALSIRPPGPSGSLPSLHHGSDSSSYESSFGRSPLTRWSPYETAWAQRGRYAGYASDTDPALVLPPLRYENTGRRGSFSAPPTGYADPSRAPATPTSPESPAGSQYSDRSPSFAPIPPPFTLQPNPIWDHTAFTSAFTFPRQARSHDNSPSRGRPSTSSGYGRGQSLTAPLRGRSGFPGALSYAPHNPDEGDPEHGLSLAVRQPRSVHRYDPIASSRTEPEASTSYTRRLTLPALEHPSDDIDDDNEEEEDD